MNLKNIVTFLILVWILQITPAQPIAVPATLKDLVDQAFSKYPRVESMTQLVRLNEVQVELTKDSYLPVATGNVSYRRLYPSPSIDLPLPNVPTIHFTPVNNYNAGIDVVQPILDFNTGAKIGKARSNLVAATDNLESVKTQLAYQVAQIYYGIIFLNKSLLVQQQQLGLLAANLQQIKVKMQNGAALKYDQLSTQVQYTNTENNYIDLQNQLNKQYSTLNILTGRTGINYLTDTINYHQGFVVVPDSVLSKTLSNNMELKIASDRIETTKWDIIAASRLRMPIVNLTAGGGFKNGFAPDIETNKFNYYVGVGVSIPILPSSRPSKQRKMAEISLNAYTLDLSTQTLTVTNNLQNAQRDVEKNEKKLASCDDLVKQAQAALMLATERYKEGVNTNLDLLTAQTNYQNALLSKLQFEYNLILSKIEVNQLAGNKWW